MIPLTTTIEGFGSHEKTTIDWSKLQSPIAIQATYGTGKTVLTDSIPAGLGFGFPWYSDNVYDVLTQGGTGVGRITQTFSHGGVRYMVDHHVKDTGKTKTHKAVLTLADTGEMIAGPKVGDFCAKIQSMIGDRDTYLATGYMSQSREGDLCGLKGQKGIAAYRRGIFCGLIGADTLDASEERIGGVMRKAVATVEELEAQLAGEPDFQEEIEASTRKMDSEILVLPEGKRLWAEAETKLEAARTRLRDAEGGDAELRAMVSEHERCRSAASQAADRVLVVESELKSRALVASGLEAAVGKRERLEMFQRLRETHQAEQVQFDEWQRWDWKRREIEKDIEAAQNSVTTLEGFPGVDEETKALAARLSELREQYQHAKTQNDQAEASNREVESKRRGLEQSLNAISLDLQRVRAEIGEKPETPFGEDCKPCPLMQKWADLPRQEDALAEKKGRIETALAIIPDPCPIPDLTGLIAEGEQAKGAAKSVKDAAETEEKLAENRADLSCHRATLQEHLFYKRETVADPRDAVKEAQREIDENAGAPERVKACEQAAIDAAQKKSELGKAETALAEARTAEEAARGPAESAKASLANREEQRAALRAEVETLDAKVKNLRAEVEELTRQIAKHEARIEELERRQAEQAEKRARVKKLRDDIAGYTDLRLCFGPKGVRQILIDDAAPALESIADTLYQLATGGKMRLRIATQKVLEDGSTAEDFEILVRDHGGERGVLQYSGGELHLNMILFRIAVAVWLGQIRGTKPDSLFLDEAFDRLGAEGTDDLMRVIEYLDDKIKFLVVVTHDPQIADRMRSQVRLSKTFGGVTVETTGGAG